MKLIYIDPHCSGLQTVDCASKEDIEKVLENQGMTEDCCEVIHYVYVDKDGTVIEKTLYFT